MNPLFYESEKLRCDFSILLDTLSRLGYKEGAQSLIFKNNCLSGQNPIRIAIRSKIYKKFKIQVTAGYYDQGERGVVHMTEIQTTENSIEQMQAHNSHRTLSNKEQYFKSRTPVYTFLDQEVPDSCIGAAVNSLNFNDRPEHVAPLTYKENKDLLSLDLLQNWLRTGQYPNQRTLGNQMANYAFLDKNYDELEKILQTYSNSCVPHSAIIRSVPKVSSPMIKPGQLAQPKKETIHDGLRLVVKYAKPNIYSLYNATTAHKILLISGQTEKIDLSQFGNDSQKKTRSVLITAVLTGAYDIARTILDKRNDWSNATKNWFMQVLNKQVGTSIAIASKL